MSMSRNRRKLRRFLEHGCVRSTGRRSPSIPARCGWVFDPSRAPFWLRHRGAEKSILLTSMREGRMDFARRKKLCASNE